MRPAADAAAHQQAPEAVTNTPPERHDASVRVCNYMTQVTLTDPSHGPSTEIIPDTHQQTTEAASGAIRSSVFDQGRFVMSPTWPKA